MFHRQHGYELLPCTIELYIHNGALMSLLWRVMRLYYFILIYFPTHNPFCYADFQIQIF